MKCDNDFLGSSFKYDLVCTQIIADIASGIYASDSKIPTETKLMKQFGVSRQTVRNAIKKLSALGYIRSVQGSGNYVIHRTNEKAKKIGVLFTDTDGYICSDIFSGIEATLSELGYTIQIELSHNSVDNEARFLKRVLQQNIAGIIVKPAQCGFPSPNSYLYRKLDEVGIPYVFVNEYPCNVLCNAVVWDDEKIAYLMTRHLIKVGHTRIGCLFRFDEMQGHKRYLGYAKAMRKNQLVIDEKNIGWYSLYGQEPLSKRNNADIDCFIEYAVNNCTALICYNDIIAGVVISKATPHKY